MKKKAIFFCYTQYHIFNAINITMSQLQDFEVDLIIYNSDTGNTDSTYKNLKKEHVFNNIYLINNTYAFSVQGIKKYFLWYCKYFNFFNNRKIFLSIYNNKKVEIAFSYGSAGEFYILFDILKKNNKNIKFYNYEEGCGSYTQSSENALKRRDIFFIEKLMRMKMPIYPDKFYLYEPKLVSTDIPCSVDKMPKVASNNNELRSVYNRVFNYDYFKINKRFIYFDQPLSNNKLILIVKEILKEDSLIKMHPRSKNIDIYNGVDVFKQSSLPWEIILLNDEVNNTIFITFFSTACLSAKIIFNKEPFLILLFELEELKGLYPISQNMKKFIYKFINSYANQEKIFVPKNYQQLIKTMHKLRGRNENF